MANNEPYTNESNATGASTNANAIETLLKKLDSNNDGILDEGLSSQVSYSNLTNVPSSFTPSSHSHTIAEVTDLQTSLNAKSDTTHTHSLTDLSNVSVSGTDAPNDGQVLKFDSSGNVWKPANDLTGTGSGSTFVGLSDTPSTLVNDQWLKVSSGSIVLTDAPSTGGGGEVNQNAFSTIAVSGQTSVAADTATDTLTIAGAGATSVTTNDSTDTVTITTELNDTDHGGNAITIASGVINHTDTSTLLEDGNNNASNSNGTVLQSITFDTFGHATAIGNVDLDARYDARYPKLDGTTPLTGNLVFEGATDDAYETTLTVTDPTVARTITFPDASGTVTLGAIDTDIQAYDADTTKNDVSNSWTAAQQGNTQTAAFSALSSGVLDFDTYQNFVITLGAGVNAFTNPTTDSGNTGQTGVIVLIQDSSASTATWTSDYKNVGGSAPTLSSGSAKVDVLPYIIQADNTILLGAPQLDFS